MIPPVLDWHQGRSGGFSDGHSIALAGPPDRGRIALHLVGDGRDPSAGRDSQDNPRPLHLEPGEGLTVSELEEDRFIIGPDS